MKGGRIPAAWPAEQSMKMQPGEAFSVALNYDWEFLNAEAVNSAFAHQHLCSYLLYNCTIDFLEEH